MAIFHITPATSVFTNAPGANGFDSGTPSADTLIVDPGAFLIATDGHGATLGSPGAWTVTVNGSIVSTTKIGLFLDVAASTVTIGVNGEVQGVGDGIFLGSSASINN